VPSVIEWQRRASNVFNAIRDGNIVHNDIAKYQMYLATSVTTNRKPIMGRNDIADVLNRITASVKTIPDEGMSFFMNDEIEKFRALSHYNKVEWMTNGHYTADISDDYAKSIMSYDTCIAGATRARVPPKLVDTMNFSDYEVAYKLWCGSLDDGGKTVSYTGPAYWIDLKRVIYTTVKVMSIVMSPTRMVTATIIFRGTMKRLL